MGGFIYLMIIVGYIAYMISKIKARANGGKNAKSNASGTSATAKYTYTRPGQKSRSFAAMPKQAQGVPNVERNCSAEEKHRYENNISGHQANLATAIPNMPVSNMRKQPKMSGNRKTAKQLYMGDPVPRGNKVIICSYCAAENIVPSGAHNEYKCYFCHYDI